jgi:hypothetical protein
MMWETSFFWYSLVGHGSYRKPRPAHKVGPDTCVDLPASLDRKPINQPIPDYLGEVSSKSR